MIGARRHRVTLMGEELSQGAGGRLQKNRLIIADVWAEVSQSGRFAAGTTEAPEHTGKADFTVPYQAAYLAARHAEWEGRLYRLEGYSLTGTTVRLISFDGVRAS
ncbi:head-tail adaptor protein [Kordiimonas aestuarii]|uniref:hypothetical protein n=1 Tax=Kordiimonas aestuarii TaxID=1005925 RepID=UPI0021D3EAA4|nr:hypothetical protein [Kordiimonas aestuarii]